MKITSVTQGIILYVDLDDESFEFVDDHMGGWSEGLNSICTSYDAIEEMADDEDAGEEIRKFAKEVIKRAKKLKVSCCDVVIQRDDPK